MTFLASRQRPIIVNSSPSFEFPDSQLVTASQFYEERFLYWANECGFSPVLDRKTWEYCFILNAIDAYCCTGKDKRGLGFGVSRERIPAVLVKHGSSVTVTDFIPTVEKSHGWEASKIDDLVHSDIVDRGVFLERADFMEVDMNNIPAGLKGYDFLWSTGSLEHIGSRANGLSFIKAAMNCLKPGGIAVHTTEFTLTSKSIGYDSEDLNFYCRKDIEGLAFNLLELDHMIILNFRRGNTIADTHVDVPPYHYGMTLSAHFLNHIITSIGLIIKKSTESIVY